MTPELQEMRAQIEVNKTGGQAVCAGLSDAQLNWRPGPDRWSIAECLHHLNIAVTRTLPAFDRAIAGGRAQGTTAPGPFQYGWFSRWMIGSMEPPPKRRMRTFRIFAVPAGATYAATALVLEFAAVRDQLTERLRRADGLDLGRLKVVSPVNRLLRMPLGAYFAFVIAHDRRHVWQASQVRNAPGFGAAG